MYAEIDKLPDVPADSVKLSRQLRDKLRTGEIAWEDLPVIVVDESKMMVTIGG